MTPADTSIGSAKAKAAIAALEEHYAYFSPDLTPQNSEAARQTPDPACRPADLLAGRRQAWPGRE